MGVVYKLTQEIKDFIIEQKRLNARLGCRKLVDLVKERFDRNVSKSSINTVLKKANLSSPVGRRNKKTSKEDQFKIPQEIKKQLSDAAKKYIDESLLGSSEETANQDQCKSKSDSEMGQNKESASEENNILEELKILDIKGDKEKKDEVDDFSDTKEVNKQESNSLINQNDALTWEIIDEIDDGYADLDKEEPLILRADPIEENPESESKSIGTNDVTRKEPLNTIIPEATIVNERKFQHFGSIIFKAVQWYISNKPLLYNVLQTKIHNVRDNDIAILSDWLPAAKFFNHDVMYLDNGTLTESELFYYEDTSEKHLVDLVRDFSEIEDGFGFGMDVSSELNMALTMISKVGVKFSSGDTVMLRPDLSGIVTPSLTTSCPLNYVLMNLADRLINNITPLMWGVYGQSKLSKTTMSQFCAMLNSTTCSTIKEITVYDSDENVVASFQNIVKQKRHIIFGIESQDDIYQQVMRFSENPAFSKRIPWGTQAINIIVLDQIKIWEGYDLVYISGDGIVKEQILLTNLSYTDSSFALAIQHWLMKYQDMLPEITYDAKPSLPNIMDMEVAQWNPVQHVSAVRQVIFDYFSNYFLPKSLQYIDLNLFISRIALLPVGVVALPQSVFFSFENLPNDLDHQEFEIMLHRFNRAAIRDFQGRIMYFSLKKVNFLS